MKNKIKIIAGEWRGRQLTLVDIAGLRPTPARVRETLFNWLQYDITGSRCLDLFAGSGALGFEATSRGAKKVVQVENNPTAFQQLKENSASLLGEWIGCVNQDVFHFLSGASEPFDVVFLDPPFGMNLAVQCCQCLEENGWLADNAKIYVETEKRLSLDGMPENWKLLKSGKAGEVGYHLFVRSAGRTVDL